MQHKGAVLELIQDALFDAFPQRDGLAQMERFKLEMDESFKTCGDNDYVSRYKGGFV